MNDGALTQTAIWRERMGALRWLILSSPRICAGARCALDYKDTEVCSWASSPRP